jgi:hyaluronoglucosaminidase
MSFAIRGFIEGFYGRPYSWPERERLVDFLGKHGYNMYVYAPKNDPIHRNRWREPYLPEEIEHFATLQRRCETLGIEFVFGISPLQYHYSSEEYWTVLWSKLLPMYQIGIRSFTVLLDDMPEKFHYPDDEERFGSIAKAQVWLNNTVLERLAALGGVRRMTFCPTEYHGEGVSDYLKTLGEGLRKEIEVFWTGTEICAQHLRTEDARKVSETLQRPVLYWDNYPVNDGEMHWQPHIRPIRGRDADLDTAAVGIVANGAMEPEAQKIPLHTYAAYMADPVNYEPEAAWQKALLEVAGNPEDAAAAGLIGDLSRWSALERKRQLHSSLAPKIARFWQRWGGAPAEAGPDLPDLPAIETDPPADAGTRSERATALADLQQEFERMADLAARFDGKMENPYLQADLLPWAKKMAGWAEVGKLGLQVLARTLANPADPQIPTIRERTLDRILETRENFHWLAGDLIDQFARRCLWAASDLLEETTRG